MQIKVYEILMCFTCFSINITKCMRILTGLLRFQNTLTITSKKKVSLTTEIDYYSYKKLPDKNSGFKNLEKSGRVATLSR